MAGWPSRVRRALVRFVSTAKISRRWKFAVVGLAAVATVMMFVEAACGTSNGTADRGSSGANVDGSSGANIDQGETEPDAAADSDDDTSTSGDVNGSGGQSVGSQNAQDNSDDHSESETETETSENGTTSELDPADDRNDLPDPPGDEADDASETDSDLETDETFVDTFTQPLTGLAADADTFNEMESRRPLVAKVDNSNRRSRPQAGVTAADVVFEELIEGARTRFMAVFHSDIPTRIGPIRSARSTDIDLLRDLDRPYFVFSGGNAIVLREVRAAHQAGVLVPGGANESAAFYQRDTERSAPYNLYFRYDPAYPEILSRAAESSSSVQPLFEYGPSTGALGSRTDPSPPWRSVDEVAVGVRIGYRNRDGSAVSHIWDDDAQGWVRIQDGTAHTVETDGGGLVEIAPANVVVLRVAYKSTSADVLSPQAVSYGTGDAWVLTQGLVIEGSWERTEDRVGYRLTDNDGETVTLAPGQTWVVLANRSGSFPLTLVDVIYDYCYQPLETCGSQMLAEARDV